MAGAIPAAVAVLASVIDPEALTGAALEAVPLMEMEPDAVAPMPALADDPRVTDPEAVIGAFAFALPASVIDPEAGWAIQLAVAPRVTDPDAVIGAAAAAVDPKDNAPVAVAADPLLAAVAELLNAIDPAAVIGAFDVADPPNVIDPDALDPLGFRIVPMNPVVK